MDSTTSIYIAGHRGLVGSALTRTLSSRGHTNLITRTYAKLDLTNQAAVNEFFAAEKPELVFLAAAELVNLGSSCIYPKLAPPSMKEEHLLTLTLSPTRMETAKP
jgi:GDP-L-fucose synthase